MNGKQRFLRLSGFGLILLALLIGLYTLIAYLGWQSGQTLRADRVQAERTAAVETQITRAQEEIEAGNYRLALRRLEWVLENDPDYPEARTLQEQAQQALDAASAPTATPPPTVATTATPMPDEPDTAPAADAPVAEFRALQTLVDEEEWEEAVTAITHFQGEYPDYERQETDRLLFEAYIGHGVELLYSERVELGIYYLDQAERLGALPQEARDQRQWAELYLNGMAYYGVGWGVSIANFRQLCLAAPFYQNSCDKLHAGLVAYADQYAAQQDWCPAESFYAEAYRLQSGDTVGDKLAQAREGCQSATPTATAPITGTVPLTGTDPITATGPITGE